MNEQEQGVWVTTERLADAIANALPVPSMLDVDFAEDVANAIMAELEGPIDE